MVFASSRPRAIRNASIRKYSRNVFMAVLIGLVTDDYKTVRVPGEV
jgi:hypothetical protein